MTYIIVIRYTTPAKTFLKTETNERHRLATDDAGNVLTWEDDLDALNYLLHNYSTDTARVAQLAGLDIQDGVVMLNWTV